MYKKGREPKINVNLNTYVESLTKSIRPYIKAELKDVKSSYVNSRELDDKLCEDLKDSKELVDGEHRWIEIHRSLRVRIIIQTLIKEFGYEMWSGKTKKVLYKPPSGFKRASELAETKLK